MNSPHFFTSRVRSPSFSFTSRPYVTMVLSRLSLVPGSKELALSSPAVSRAHGHLRPAQILLTNHQTCPSDLSGQFPGGTGEEQAHFPVLFAGTRSTPAYCQNSDVTDNAFVMRVCGH